LPDRIPAWGQGFNPASSQVDLKNGLGIGAHGPGEGESISFRKPDRLSIGAGSACHPGGLGSIGERHIDVALGIAPQRHERQTFSIGRQGWVEIVSRMVSQANRQSAAQRACPDIPVSTLVGYVDQPRPIRINHRIEFVGQVGGPLHGLETMPAGSHLVGLERLGSRSAGNCDLAQHHERQHAPKAKAGRRQSMRLRP
jgi:hypothetical protein